MENNFVNLNVNMDGLSKAFKALVDAVSRGWSTIYEPTHTVRMAKAKAKEKLILAEAENKEKAILAVAEQQVGNDISSEKLNAMVSRMVSQEIKRQENINAVVQFALENLNSAKTIPEQKADTYWLTRFFNLAEDVSDDEIRRVWGKVLSQEIQSPGSYSLRTLTTISNLSKREAELFTKIGNYIFESDVRGFLVRSHSNVLGANIRFEDISLLMECGLIKEAHDLNITYHSDDSDIKVPGFIYQDLAIIIQMEKKSSDINIPIYQLTTAGSEIHKILTVEKDMSYLQLVAGSIKRPNVRIGYSKLIGVKDGFMESDDNITYL